MLSRYLNVFDAIDWHRNMQKYESVLEKYWLKQSSYFRIRTTVEWGMGMVDAKLSFCHVLSWGNRDK